MLSCAFSAVATDFNVFVETTLEVCHSVTLFNCFPVEKFQYMLGAPPT